MTQKRDYQKTARELDKIILAELNFRMADNKVRPLSPDAIYGILEKKNREIVKAHQAEKIAAHLPALFSAYLQTRPGGRLYLDENALYRQEFEDYTDIRSRLEVLFSASLNALQEPDLKQIVNEKYQRFEEMYQKTFAAIKLTHQAQEIQNTAHTTSLMIPRDEDEAIAYLREIAPLRADLREIEAGYVKLKQTDCMPEALENLQGAIHLAAKGIAAKSKRASKFIFHQADAVFQRYKSTPSKVLNANLFMVQKEELERYYALFDSIGDEDRKKQTRYFISSIEKTLAHLQKEIEKQKVYETVLSERDNLKIKKAYDQFLNIKSLYAEGKLDTGSKQKKAVKTLKKCCDSLKSNGQRIKAREIERFLNSTGIANPPVPSESPPQQTLFYKRAFFILLPFTIGLALITVYYLISG